MNTLELIERLEEMVKKYGNKEVIFENYNDENETEITCIISRCKNNGEEIYLLSNFE